MQSFLIAQLIGCIALGLFVLAFQFNKRHTMLKLQIWACLAYALHLLLLGAYTGSALTFVTAIRNYVYSRYGTIKYRLLLPIIFIIIFIVAGLVTWQGYLSLLPLSASIAGAIGYWQQSPRVIRLVEIASTPLLFVYNLASHSYPGVAIEIIFFTTTLIGIYRFDVRHANGRQRIPAE